MPAAMAAAKSAALIGGCGTGMPAAMAAAKSTALIGGVGGGGGNM